MKRWSVIVSLLYASSCTADHNLWVFHASQPIKSVSMFDDNKRIAVLTQNEIHILDAKTGKEIKRISGTVFGRFPQSRTAVHVIECHSTTCWIGGGEHRLGFIAKVNIDDEVGSYIESDTFAEIFGIAIGKNQEIVSAHGDSSAIVWNGEKLHLEKKIYLTGGLENWAVDYYGNNYLLGNDNGELAIWDGKSNVPQQRFLVANGIDKDSNDSIFVITSINGFIVVGGANYLELINARNLTDKRYVGFKKAAVLSCDTSDKDSLIWCGLFDGSIVSVGLDGKIKSFIKAHDEPIIFVKTLPEIIISVSRDGFVKANTVQSLAKIGQEKE